MRRFLTVAICATIMLGAVGALQAAENYHRAKVLSSTGVVPNSHTSLTSYETIVDEATRRLVTLDSKDPRTLLVAAPRMEWEDGAYRCILRDTRLPYPLALIIIRYIDNPQDQYVMCTRKLSTGISSSHSSVLSVRNEPYYISPAAMRMIIEGRYGATTKPLINMDDCVD